MIFLLIGAPGAGKGTQADLLADKGGFVKISTGDALRMHVKAGTDVGKQAEAIMARGELVPDSVLLNILRAELVHAGDKHVILDGYPRNVPQAETLKGLEDHFPVRGCIHLDVKRDVLIERLAGRRVCSGCQSSYHVSASPSRVAGVCDRCGKGLVQRPDDEPKSISVRLDVYDRNTQPVLDYYKGRNLYCRINGLGDPLEIFKEIQAVIGEAGSLSV
jgi:adenylate kinase